MLIKSNWLLMLFDLLYPYSFSVYLLSHFIERDALKSLTKTVDLLFFPGSSINFCCIYYENLFLDG